MACKKEPDAYDRRKEFSDDDFTKVEESKDEKAGQKVKFGFWDGVEQTHAGMSTATKSMPKKPSSYKADKVPVATKCTVCESFHRKGTNALMWTATLARCAATSLRCGRMSQLETPSLACTQGSTTEVPPSRRNGFTVSIAA